MSQILAIKWPNDILSDHHKIAGILIENIIKTNQIESSVIGIGLNVNQKSFKGLPKVSFFKNYFRDAFNDTRNYYLILQEYSILF